MPAITRNEIPVKQLMPGINGQYIHTGTMSIGYVDLDKDAILPEHSHPHEQVTCMLEGELLMVLNGQECLLTAGMTLVIPGNTPHGARALTDCKLVDIFNPEREDYK
jgi:quercetin dioxygenase-like cupin family protein